MISITQPQHLHTLS